MNAELLLPLSMGTGAATSIVAASYLPSDLGEMFSDLFGDGGGGGGRDPDGEDDEEELDDEEDENSEEDEVDDELPGEDEINEVIENATDNGIDVEQRLTDFEQVISELRNEIDETEASLETTDSDVEALREEVEKLDDRTTELAKLYDAFAAQLNPMVEGGTTEVPQPGGITEMLLDEVDDYQPPKPVVPEERPSDEDDSSNGDTNSGNGGGEGENDAGDESGRPARSEPVNLGRQHSDPVSRGGRQGKQTGGDTSGFDRELIQSFNVDEDALPLQSLPDDDLAQLVINEWVLMLVSNAGRAGARDALEMYREIGHISREVEEELVEGRVGEGGDGDATLSVRDHERSLAYITCLAELE